MIPPLRIPAFVLLCSGFLLAQEETAEPALASGPAPGTALTPVRCYATDGPLAGQEFDAAERLRRSPAAFLFIHELTRNTAPVLRGLDELASEFAILGFRSQTILLSGDRTEAEAQLKRVNGSLQFANPIVLSTDGAEGPGNYALNRKASLTLVFAKDGAVEKSLALTDTGPNDLPVLRAAIEAMTGAIPAEEAAFKKLIAQTLPTDPEALKDLAADQAFQIRRLRERIASLQAVGPGAGMQRKTGPAEPMRKGAPGADRPDRPGAEEAPKPAGPREGKPPEDPELLSSLRSYIRKTNDDARTDEVFAGIKARAAQSEALQAEVVEMFKLMLSIDYGTEHAQELAKAFLAEAAPAAKDE